MAVSTRRRAVTAPAQERLARLLAIVPWVVARDGPLIAEVCARFAVSERDLLADLQLLFLCGVYPYTPDALIEVDVADGRVWIRMADYFRRPLRLTPQEGLALVSAGSTLLAVPGADSDGALARALAKLEAVLGVGAGEDVDVALGQAAPDVLDVLRAGVDGPAKVEIDYYSFGRDSSSVRVVQPWRVFNQAGEWYLSGWCELAAGERLFRVDRISQARLTGSTFKRPTRASAQPPVYQPGPDDPRWVLDLDPPAHWVAERYPNDGVASRPDGRLRVTLRSGQRAWVERLLLRAGPHATVVEGDTSVRSEAAARLLQRYRSPA
ncbi:MAG: WYL domain-containing protein [Acidimicrobiaceae bacterium]|nr:WYL domain-containing protein [Acidimicrobiaceae bacterium]